MAEVDTAQAALNLGYTEVKAPFDGIVTARQVSLGELVGANGPTQLATIVQTGITTGNLCSSASPAPRPGVLVLYEIPKTFIPVYPAPPLPPPPHSDENPHAPPN